MDLPIDLPILNLTKQHVYVQDSGLYITNVGPTYPVSEQQCKLANKLLDRLKTSIETSLSRPYQRRIDVENTMD